MKIQHVDTAWVPQVWAQVESFLAAALEHAQGEYTLEQVQLLLTSGQWLLLVALNDDGDAVCGAGAAQLFNRGAHRVAFIKAVGGQFIATSDGFEQVRTLLLTLGATYIECAARPSAARLWQQIGMTPKYQILGAQL